MLTNMDCAFSKSGRKSFTILDTCIKNKNFSKVDILPESPVESRAQSPTNQDESSNSSIDSLMLKALGPTNTCTERPTRRASMNINYAEA